MKEIVVALYRTKNEEDWRVVAHVTVLMRAFSEAISWDGYRAE